MSGEDGVLAGADVLKIYKPLISSVVQVATEGFFWGLLLLGFGWLTAIDVLDLAGI